MHNIHQSKRNTTHLLHSTRSPVTSINNIYTAHTHTHTRTHTIIYQSSQYQHTTSQIHCTDRNDAHPHNTINNSTNTTSILSSIFINIIVISSNNNTTNTTTTTTNNNNNNTTTTTTRLFLATDWTDSESFFSTWLHTRNSPSRLQPPIGGHDFTFSR